MGSIVRRLYAEELKSAARGSAVDGGRSGWSGVRRRIARLKKALGSRRALVWAIRIAVVVAVLVAVLEAVYQFNQLTSWYTIVAARRADVDRELRRRENLIPNLVYAAGRYAVYERAVFKYVSDAREMLKMIQNSQAPKVEATGDLAGALSRLVALAEEYPDLKSSRSIQDLMDEATNTEDRITEAKKEYNKAAEIYNQYRTIVPGNLFAFLFRFEPAVYIGLDEAVKVPAMDLHMKE